MASLLEKRDKLAPQLFARPFHYLSLPKTYTRPANDIQTRRRLGIKIDNSTIICKLRKQRFSKARGSFKPVKLDEM